MLETPFIEPIDLFLTKAGSQFIDKLFVIDQQDAQFALRPEFTASAVLHYISQGQADRCMRWQFRGPVFQLNPDTEARQYVQRYSIGAEFIGVADITADAEIISLATQAIDALGIHNWTLTIGDLSVLRAIINSFDLNSRTQRFLLNQRFNLQNPDLGKAKVLDNLNSLLASGLNAPLNESASDATQTLYTQQMLDVLLDTTRRGQTMGGRTLHDIAHRLLSKQQRLNERERIMAAVEFLDQWVRIEGSIPDVMAQVKHLVTNETHLLDNWMRLFELLEAYGIDLNRVRIKPDLVRNWDYYTGTVFEIRTNDEVLLAGGGRYDELARLVGSKTDIPAVGFAIYIDNLLGISCSQSPAVKIRTIQYGAANAAAAIQWASILRHHQIPVELMTISRNNIDNLTIVDNELQIENIRYHLDEIDTVIEKLTTNP